MSMTLRMGALERGTLEFPEVIHYFIKSRQSQGADVPGTGHYAALSMLVSNYQSLNQA